MNDLQALVTGAIAGGLMEVGKAGLSIEASIRDDGEGNYLPEIDVTGLSSGTKLLVEVKVVSE